MKNARDAAQSLAALVHADGVHLCITHGNGPQVGRLAEQASMHLDMCPSFPSEIFLTKSL